MWDYHPMLKHKDIWRAIDLLAESHGLSTSGLAKKAGLDPTTFNVSKRQSDSGKLRWPSTESLAKVLDKTNTDLDTLADFVHGRAAKENSTSTATGTVNSLPLINLTKASDKSVLNTEGLSKQTAYDYIDFPAIKDKNAFAIEISNNSMAPFYCDGDIIILSPSETNIRRGDRVMIKKSNGEFIIKRLIRDGNDHVTLRHLDPKHTDLILPRSEMDWMARIIWVSQ